MCIRLHVEIYRQIGWLIAPSHNYTAVDYGSSKFWIDASDFDSNYALSLVQNLMALAEVTDTSHAPVVTIPAK